MIRNPILKWMAVGLTLWGIPAFLFWLGVGFAQRVSVRAANERCLRDMSRTLDTLSERADGLFQDELNGLFAAVKSLPADSPEFETKRKELEKSFPPGLYETYFFDGGGRILEAAPTGRIASLSRLFDFLRRPWEEPYPVSNEQMKDLEAAIPIEMKFLTPWRSQSGEVVELRRLNPESPLPSFGFFRWDPGPPGSVRGMLTLIHYSRLPEGYSLEGGVRAIGAGTCRIGYWCENGMRLLPESVSANEFVQIVKMYQTTASRWFRFGRFFVEGRPFRDDTLLFAMSEGPRGFPGFLLAIFLAYAGLSLGIWRKMHRIILGADSWQWTLGRKLALLFFGGAVFPVFAATFLALLFLQEKRADLLEEHRREAFQRLTRIDNGFERSLGHLERRYQNLSQGYSNGRISLADLETSLKKEMDDFYLEDFHIVSSHSLFVKQVYSRKRSEFRYALTLPPEKRRILVRDGIRKKETVFFNEIECLLGRWDYDLLDPKSPPSERERTEKILLPLLEEALTFVNAQSGLGGPPLSGKPGVSLAGLADQEGLQRLFQFLKLYLGQLVESREASSGFIFNDVLKDRKGEGQYFLALNIPNFGAQREYLQSVFAGQIWGKGEEEIRCIAHDYPYSIDFPIGNPVELRRIWNRLELANAPSLVTTARIDGRDMEITALRAKKLWEIVLFHLTPVPLLDQRLFPSVWRAVLLIVGASVFSLILGYLLIQKFLIPLYGLSEGVRALRDKRFEHRVQVLSADEIGHLGEVLNATIAHMKNMELASLIQGTLCPQGKRRVGPFEIVARNQMTQAIGGDYFDFIPLAGEKLAVVFGDVAGHGVSAALVTGMAKGGFTILCPALFQEPARILESMNRLLVRFVGGKKMMTVFLGILDPIAGTLEVANAGHNFPVLVAPGAESRFLELVSNPLGIRKNPKIRSQTVSLTELDLVIYSDGLPEATDASGNPLGYDRFRQIVKKVLAERPADPAERIFQEVRAFTDPVPWMDDATLVVIRKHPG